MKFRQASISIIPTVSSTLESGFCAWARREHAIKPVANSIDHAIAVICMFTLLILRRLILDSSDNTVSRKLLFWDLWKICPIEYQECIFIRDYYIIFTIISTFILDYNLPSHVHKRVNVHNTFKDIKENKPNQNLSTHFHPNVNVLWKMAMNNGVNWRFTKLFDITFGAKYAI